MEFVTGVSSKWLSMVSTVRICIELIDKYKLPLISVISFFRMGSMTGDVRFWDPRKPESIQVLHTMNGGLTSFDAHPRADILAW